MPISGQNNISEYFGSTSNFSFVNQLNNLLRPLLNSEYEEQGKVQGLERFGIKPTILEYSWSFDLSLENFSTESMNKLLVAYLETWAIPIPVFNATELFTLASKTWMNPHASPEDRALLYLVLSTGAATSYFDNEESSPNAFPVAKAFYNLAFQTVPTIFSKVSFDSVRIILLMCLCACSLGDTALSYTYIGFAMRILLAIGLHKNNVVKVLSNSFGSSHHKRVWAAVWQFNKYWSFSVGRPNGISDNVGAPLVKEEDFKYDGYGELKEFKMTVEHLRVRICFASLLLKIDDELYNSKNDLLTMVGIIEQFSYEIDDVYLSSSDMQIIQTDVTDDVKNLRKERIIEWFWIRIYYLYIKLILFRPFLIFSAYLDNNGTQIPDSLRNKIEAGSKNCVDVAIELSDFIIKLNNKVRLTQPIVFISTYLEGTSTVLLFYIVSNFADISDNMARKLWKVLQDIRDFLNGSYGCYLDTTKILARDGLNSLYNVLTSRNIDKNDRSFTYLDKIMEPVISTRLGNATQNAEIEEIWHKALNSVTFS